MSELLIYQVCRTSQVFNCCSFWKQLVDSVEPINFDWSCDQAEDHLMTSLLVCISVEWGKLLHITDNRFYMRVIQF